MGSSKMLPFRTHACNIFLSGLCIKWNTLPHKTPLGDSLKHIYNKTFHLYGLGLEGLFSAFIRLRTQNGVNVYKKITYFQCYQCEPEEMPFVFKRKLICMFKPVFIGILF